MLSFSYETYLDTIMTLPSIAVEVFGKTQAGETRGCGAHFCQCRIGNRTDIHFLYTLWLGTGFGAFRARVDISISRQWCQLLDMSVPVLHAEISN